jgi:hypothetical protein
MKISRAQFARYEKVRARGTNMANLPVVSRLAGITSGEAMFIYANYEGFKYGRLKLERQAAPVPDTDPDSCGFDPTVNIFKNPK